MEASDVVEPVFQSIRSRVRAAGVEDQDALRQLSPVERAIYVTRVIEAQLDNGGWYQVFSNGVDHLIEPAIEGYNLLGAPDYAAHFRTVREAGFAEDTPEEIGERLDTAYFSLHGSEDARAAAIRAADQRVG